MMMVENADLRSMSRDDLVTAVEEIRELLYEAREELRDLQLTSYSEEEHELALDRARDEAEDAVRSEYRSEFGDLAKTAHRILSDLAWRATTGDPAAQAAEAEVGDFLALVRDEAA